MFFKGYVETKDKKCIEKFKGRTDFKNYEQVQSLPEFAGILATDTILIDIDDFDESEILFKIVQDLKIGIEAIKKTNWGISRDGTAREGHRNNGCKHRIQEMKEEISGVEGIVEEMNIPVKENVKPTKFLTQNVQEIWDTIKILT